MSTTTTTKAPTIKVRLGLNIWSENRDGYFRIYAAPVTIGPNAWEQRSRIDGTYAYPDIKDDTVRNCSDREMLGGLLLHDLRVTSFASVEYRNQGLSQWEVIYQDVHTIDRREAEQMAKALKTIEARMKKLDERWGRATTYGAYLARVAAAIGADAMLTAQRPNSTWHREADYQWFSVADGVYHVDRLVTKWMTPETPAAVSA